MSSRQTRCGTASAVGWLRSAYDRLPAMVALAAAAGVRVLASSDTGQHAHGTLRPADLATYASDPRTDLETLCHPELIILPAGWRLRSTDLDNCSMIET
jgi:hypothetical protein